MTKPPPSRRADDPSTDPQSLHEAMKVARGSDAAARQRLAKRTDIAPELLFYLAEDTDTAVRRAVAANPSTPRRADEFLARDADDTVRASVAARVAASVA